MTTDVFDEHRFTSQLSLYEPVRRRLSKETTRHTRTNSSVTIFESESTNSINRPQRIKYSTQQTISSTTTTTSVQQRNTGSNDIITLFRTFAMKPFRTSSMINATGEGQINNPTPSNHSHGKPTISLLKYRPLSENVSDQTSNIQSTRVCIQKGSLYLKRQWIQMKLIVI